MAAKMFVKSCGNTSLGLDQACLTVADEGIVEVAAQSAECVGCPLSSIWHGGGSDTILVNTSFTTFMKVTTNKIGRSSCDLTYHFREFGDYQLRSDCGIDVLSEGTNAFLPILYVFVSLVALRLFWAAVRRVYLTRRFRSRWILLRLGVSVEVQQDLGSLGDGLEEEEEETQSVQESAGDRRRVKSLDVFRGLTVALMIFVNYGGGEYWFFKHAAWNGLRLADLVFPWFMWIMGVSICLSVHSQLRRGVSRKMLAGKILKRSLILFTLGLCLNSGGNSDFRKIRIPGVLQRFAATYFVAGSLEAILMPREMPASLGYFRDILQNSAQLLLALCSVGLHTCITFLLPVPGCPTGYLGPGGLHDNGHYPDCTGGAARHLDVIFFGNAHIYQRPTARKVYSTTVPFDPEGLLGTLTALLIVLLGVQCGKTMLAFPGWKCRIGRWLLWALLLGAVAGMLCGFAKEGGVIPVNKNLWSLSFVLATASMAFFAFSLLYLVVDVFQTWSGSPFLYAGMNPISLYVGHELCRGYFPFAWRPFTVGHGELLSMNIWATGLWIFVSYCLYKNDLFLAL